MDKRRLAVLGVGNEIRTPSPLGHPCDSQQGQELTKCGLNWWWQSSSLLPDVQIIKVTTVTGTTIRPHQRIQIIFLTGYWKAMEKRVLPKLSWSMLWGRSQNGCSCRICSVDAQTAPISTAIKSTLNSFPLQIQNNENKTQFVLTSTMKGNTQLIDHSFHSGFVVHHNSVCNGKPTPHCSEFIFCDVAWISEVPFCGLISPLY